MSNSVDENINIVCVSDTNYVPHLVTLLKSVQSNSDQDDTFKVHIIHDAISEDLQKLISAELRAMEVRWYSIVGHDALTLPPLLQISRATYLRLIMDEVLDESISRLIYLDIDMVVTGSLKELWQCDLGDCVCAAVPDPGINIEAFAQKYNFTLPGQYFNAGMMVFDMHRARIDGILRGALNLLLEHPSKFEYADQDALNVVLWGKWKQVDATWNFQREFMYDDLAAWRVMSRDRHTVPKIIHFTESVKPWKAGEWHPFAWLYWKHLLRSGFAGEVMRKENIRYRDIIKMWLKYLFKKPNLARGSANP
ncbi:glycosyltransferase family 8 protein [Mesorhizobium sp. Cs1299R1N3]|uniref:glycosyltransferase family 8 protein n=1 Tax=Mesorhizobium sp. Cs1299R1N3 TaxID=3015173 RepID=UPI00301BF2C9